jgi:hypothetical protein
VLFVLYLCASVFAHQAALSRVEEFIAQRGLLVESYGALPMPAWMAEWSGLIRTPNGVYYAPVHLLSSEAPEFRFIADSEPNGYTARVRNLPEVQAFFRFARFPVTRYFIAGQQHTVELYDYRFFRRQRETGGPVGFTYRVTLDAQGSVLSHGWVND